MTMLSKALPRNISLKVGSSLSEKSTSDPGPRLPSLLFGVSGLLLLFSSSGVKTFFYKIHGVLQWVHQITVWTSI